MSMAGGDDKWWQSTMNNANSVQIIREDLCPWWVAMTINWQYFNSVQIVRENLCLWQVMTINDNQQWIMPTLHQNRWRRLMSVMGGDNNRWQSTMNNANSVQILREDLCPWQAATTIDDNQLAITSTVAKSLEKIYVCGRQRWQSMTINNE